MSWAAWLKKEDELLIDLVDGHTYNLSPMWREAGVFQVSSDVNGMMAHELGRRATMGVLKVLQDPQKFRDLNPKNGWGDFDGFLEILVRVALLCNEHPDYIVEWSG